MADEAAATSLEETQITFNVKAANDKKHVVTVPSTLTVAELKAKLATPEFADIPVERQRLIYSGRVLKDHDALSSYKIKDGHTVHLVKGAASNARQNPAGSQSSASSATPTPQVPTNIAAGTGNNPLAGLTGARYAGFHGLPGADTFGPDGGMGPPPDPSQLLEMMDNPMFLSQMTEAMNNPAVIDMMTQNPMIRNNPMLADMIRNPEMRRLLFNPDMMRMQLQMQRSMDAGGSRMAAPGVTNNTPQPTAGDNATATPTQNPAGSAPQDPFANLLGGAGGANPFASLLGAGGANPFAQPSQNQNQNQNQNQTVPPGTDSNTGSTQTPQGTSSPPPANPFANLFGAMPSADQSGQSNPIAEMTRQMMANPEAMRSAMEMINQMQGQNPTASPFSAFNPTPGNNNNSAVANPFAALFGSGGLGAAAPQDNRPPEEVYEVQLRQLNEMGFFEFERNVSALRRSGGNVQGAIEYLLGGGL